MMGAGGSPDVWTQPPSGGCVLKPCKSAKDTSTVTPAAFRRLCVETMPCVLLWLCCLPSRLQAAVC